MPVLPLIKINFPPSFLLTFKSQLNTTSSINFPGSLPIGIHLFPTPPQTPQTLSVSTQAPAHSCLALWSPVGELISPARLGALVGQEPTLDLVFDFSLGKGRVPCIEHIRSKCLLNHLELNRNNNLYPQRVSV